MDERYGPDVRRAVEEKAQLSANTAQWQKWIEALVSRKVKAFGERALRLLGQEFGKEHRRIDEALKTLEDERREIASLRRDVIEACRRLRERAEK